MGTLIFICGLVGRFERGVYRLYIPHHNTHNTSHSKCLRLQRESKSVSQREIRRHIPLQVVVAYNTIQKNEEFANHATRQCRVPTHSRSNKSTHIEAAISANIVVQDQQLGPPEILEKSQFQSFFLWVQYYVLGQFSFKHARAQSKTSESHTI